MGSKNSRRPNSTSAVRGGDAAACATSRRDDERGPRSDTAAATTTAAADHLLVLRMALPPPRERMLLRTCSRVRRLGRERAGSAGQPTPHARRDRVGGVRGRPVPDEVPVRGGPGVRYRDAMPDDRPPTGTRGYRLTRSVARLLLRMEYRRIETSGAERVPGAGAVLLVANHHNSLVDSMAILATSPRPAGPMAKAPLWKSRILRPFLDAVEAVPVFRPQDAAENEGRGARANLETFAECIRRLRDGRSLVLFPEGMSRPSPKLMPLRTGAARIALDAETPVSVVPVGLLYEPPAQRRGTLLVRFGEPFVVDGRPVVDPDHRAAAGAETAVAGSGRRASVAAATRRIETAIRGLIAEADSLEDVELLRVAATVEAQERGAGGESLDERHKRVQRLAEGFEALRRVDPAERAAIRAEGQAFARHLALVGIPIDLLDTRYGPGRVARFVLGTLARLVIGLPLAVAAAVATAPARFVGDVVVLRGGEATEDVLPFARIVSRTFFLAIETVLVAVLLGVLVSPLAGAVALVALPLLYVVHVIWRDWRADVSQRVRAFFLLAGGRLRRELRSERRRLVARIEQAGERIAAAGGGRMN